MLDDIEKSFLLGNRGKESRSGFRSAAQDI